MQLYIELSKAGLMKAYMYFVPTVLVYFLFFSNEQGVLNLIPREDYISLIFTMGLTVLVAALYGTAVSKLLKHTSEKALHSHCMREE